MTFYVITYYLPSGLFVVVSWISFLVNPECIPGNIISISVAKIISIARSEPDRQIDTFLFDIDLQHKPITNSIGDRIISVSISNINKSISLINIKVA